MRLAACLSLFALAFTPVALTAETPAALAAGHAVSAASAGAPTRIGTAIFDLSRGAIVVPYTGAAPQPKLYTLSGSHHYFELVGAKLSNPAVQFHRVGGPVERYTMANRPDGVRLSFQLTTSAKPTVAVDAKAHRLIIWPLGKAVAITPTPARPAVAEAPAKPAPKPVAARPAPKKPVVAQAPLPKASPKGQKPAAPVVRVPSGMVAPTAKNVLKTEVGKPFFDAANHRLVLPYKGQDPDFSVVVYYKNPKWVYFDFANAYVTAQGERFETFQAGTTFDGWMLSQRKDGLKTRLYLKLKETTQVVAQVHPEAHQIWLELPHKKPAAPKATETKPAAAPAEPEVSPPTEHE